MSIPELAWFKSSYSGGGGGDCVEVAVRSATVLVRDSEDTRREAVTVSYDVWAAFIGTFPPYVG